jgi:transposase
MERFEMSKREFEKGKLIAQVIEGFLPRVKAAEMLGLSSRQVTRLCRRYRDLRMIGLVHRSRGKPSNRKVPDTHRQNVLNLIAEKCTDFGPQLLKEMLEQEHGIKFSREWLRVLMTKEGFWKTKSRKGKKIHQSRNRRSSEGELIQIDGSYHKWFEDRGPH